MKTQVQTYRQYRLPMDITQVLVYRNGERYYVCPRCQITLDRELIAYCDRCGQCLNWNHRQKAERIYL